MNIFIRREFVFSCMGLIAIGLAAMGYILRGSDFAEINIQLPFFDFPVFIGEMLLFICLVCFSRLYIWKEDAFMGLCKWHYLLILYFIFVVAKALYGYFVWGPLAFRHAALLYYSIFAIFGYFFYRKQFFSSKTNILLFLTIIFMLIYPGLNKSWILTCFILACVLANSC